MANAFAEARFQERRSQAGPGEDGGHVVLPRLHRITFDDRAATLAHEVDRGPQEGNADPLLTAILAHEQARHRPDRRIIHLLEHARPFEGGIFLTRRDGTPADRFAVEIAQDAGRRPRIYKIPY